jgi:uncharacterized NAD-dependent epimerase/dehydratase family protein
MYDDPLAARRNAASSRFPTTSGHPRSGADQPPIATAIVYCEANFGAVDGKTANGLVRHSEIYRILSVIDSGKAGLDAGVVLDDEPNAIPVCLDLADALSRLSFVPDYFIFGVAPATGMLTGHQRRVVLDAMALGMNVVNGLHEFLTRTRNSRRRARRTTSESSTCEDRAPRKTYACSLGAIATVTCPRIAVLGTDCAIGKRTTATAITRALNDRGVKTVLVGTGQTGLMQGARYGVALDAIPSQFCSGELEATIVEAFEVEHPDVIIVEGQGALSHPAFSTSSLILRGCHPDGVVLQHAPARRHRCDFEQMPMPAPSAEIDLIHMFSPTKVIGLTINHENMTGVEIDEAIARYECELGIPVTDALTRSPDRLVGMVFAAFPELEPKLAAGAR